MRPMAAVERAVVDAHAHFLGQLQLGALDDHRFDHLALEVGLRRAAGRSGRAGAARSGRRGSRTSLRVMTSSLTTTRIESMTLALLDAGGRKPLPAWPQGWRRGGGCGLRALAWRRWP
jgi:hypothetical protein